MDGLLLSIRTAIETLPASGLFDVAFMATGGLLLLYSAVRIIRSSLVLAVWVAVAALGFASIAFGMSGSAIDLSALHEHGGDWIDRVSDGAGTGAEALARLCRQLIER